MQITFEENVKEWVVIIKKVKVTIILFLVLLVLTACAEKKEIINDEEVYTIEDIRFEEDYVFIDTEQETFVYPSYKKLDFRKTNEPSYISFKIIEDKDHTLNIFYFLMREEFKEKTIEVFINEDAVKDISRNYATEFKETLIFTDDSK
ncbi:hypothetical protein ABC382_00095 [Lysinibacillus sp. 1P01SD]|uniref:hypothetical protein n=1 Tax=Lysinibacillus sp. 1P01SD TaxID=3132285 RepID=UPI0039A3B5FA